MSRRRRVEPAAGRQVERLEDRRVMAAFQFVSAYAQSGAPFYVAGATSGTPELNEAPQQITLKFSPGVTIDPTSLGAISVARSGKAGDAFGATGAFPDVPVLPGSVVVDDTPNGNQVIVRFAENLPDDSYQILIGAGLKSKAGDSLGQPVTLNVRLNLGAYVVSVVPQPVTRDPATGGLVQSRDSVEVWFNRNDPLDQASAQTASFYRLIQMNAAGADVGPAVNPTGVVYDATTGKAVLTFAAGVADDRLFRLEIGGNPVVVAAPAVAEATDGTNSMFTQAQDLGGLGAAGATVNGAVNVRPTVSTATGGALGFPSQPGTIDEPGHRDTPVDSGNHGEPFATVDPATGITTVLYNFQDHYGDDPQGNPLHNVITENQKQRAREIFELYSLYAGVRFVETASAGLTVATGDLRAFSPNDPPTPAGLGGPKGALMNSLIDWGQSEYGGSWFQVAMHEIGHALGLEHSYDLPSIMGTGLPDAAYPGNYDIEHLRQLAGMAPTSNDIDLYKFTLAEAGTVTAQTFAGRPGQPVASLVDTVISVYRQDAGGQRTLVARNDNYYGRDSFLRLDLTAGTYYVAVTSTGNTDINPLVPDSGYGGRTEGAYQLKLDFAPATAAANTILDTTGLPLDGDRDGTAGGAFKFWFNTASAANTIYVDKANPLAGSGNGSLGNPYKTISAAVAAAGPATRVIRIAGNTAGTNGTPRPYLIGVDAYGRALSDGATFNVPKGVTMMVDAGAVFKLGAAVIDVGSSSEIVNRAGAAFQVLGTPTASTVFTSLYDDTVGGISDGFAANAGPAAVSGQWGGLVLRGDSDAASKQAFVNSIAGATFRYGGGKVRVDGNLQNFASIQLEDTRPTVVFNTVTDSAGAAIAATPNSFADTTDRVGPEFRGNTLTGNSINGLFIKIDTEFGTPLETLDVPARLKSTDIVYVIQENLVITGGVGGYELKVDPADGVEKTFARHSGRLTIDPGAVVKLQGARIELERGIAQLVAEGTASKPVIFTSLGDNRYGAGGTFDTNGARVDKFQVVNGVTNGVVAGTLSTGDWGGIILNAGAIGSIDHAYIAFGGGQTPIEGAFDSFNVIETHQGDLRLANSRVEYNAAGAASSNRTGRGGNAAATVFVLGAQPIIVGNDFRQNAGATISISANSLSDVSRPDAGRSTGLIDRSAQYDDNLGPLVRGNRLSYTPGNGLSAIAGLVVRGSEITVEGVWDDTDIVHVLQGEIIVQNFHTATGMRLVSRPDASLVVKLDGANAGFTAAGFPLDIDDRIGGTVQVVGQAGYPVILTSLKDDSVGASLDALGVTVKDTNVDGAATTPAAGDWRSLQFQSYSNDRNAAVALEAEKPLIGTLDKDTNGTTDTAQWLGVLARNYPTGTASFDSAQEKSGDENCRLGFEVHGQISPDAPGDVDVYSFTGYAGSTVWIDLDKTAASLDSMVELLDASGKVLARSVDAEAEGGVIQAEQQTDGFGGTSVTYQLDHVGVLPGTLIGTLYDDFDHVAIQTFWTGTTVTAGKVQVYFANILGTDPLGTPIAPTAAATGGTLDLQTGQLTFTFNGSILDTHVELRYAYRTSTFSSATLDPTGGSIYRPLGQSAVAGGDFYSLNPRDPGMCIVLPGTLGKQNQYFIRVRSQKAYDATTSQAQYEADLADETLVKSGATAGRYELRVRLQQRDEKPGSTVVYADIRYPTVGIDVQGLPRSSLLVGETGESPTAHGTFANAQYIGNILQADKNAISVAGTMASADDIDWYTFAVNYEKIQAIPGINDSGQTFAAMFDIDYADGFRGDLTFAVFDEDGTLLYVSRDSNVANDQPAAGQGTDFADLARASLGKLDPFLGTVTLAAGVPDGVTGIENPTVPPNADPATQVRYYVAVFSNQKLPAQLDAMFNAGSQNVAVRLEPISSVAPLVNDGFDATATDIVSTARRVVDTTNLAAHVTPFTLSDVTLFVTTATSLRTVDAMLGGVETTVSAALGANDIVMRSDGKLYGYRGLPGAANTAGTIDLIDSGTGARTNLGNDKIPDLVAATTPTATEINLAPQQLGAVASSTFQLAHQNLQAATLTGTLQYTGTVAGVPTTGTWTFTADAAGVLTITAVVAPAGLAYPQFGTVNATTGLVSVTWSEPVAMVGVSLVTTTYTYNVPGDPNSVTTDNVDALAWQRTGVGQYANLYLSVRDGTQSRLYPANTTTGLAGNRIGTFIQDAGNTLGIVTGMAFDGATLYGVDNLGHFFTVNPATAVASNVITITGAPAFSGLAIGPQNLYGGTLAHVLFAIDAGGVLRALDTAGTLQRVFDTDGNGIVDTNDATSIATGVGGATGLAFSPLDINLWHDTTKRSDDGDGSSMYFGLENTGSQYGGSATWQADLLSNPAIGNTYNLPGGAYGSLTTNAFSLAGYDYTDKPTLYFSYWLQTENANSTADMRDAARAFVSIDGGLTWEVVATNNSVRSTAGATDAELPNFASVSSRITGSDPLNPGGTPFNQKVQEIYDTANWRQVRIDLGEFAGQANMRLRFDFTTAGVMDAGAVWRTTKTAAADAAATTTVTFADVSNLFAGLTAVALDGSVLGTVQTVDTTANTVTLDAAVTLAAGDVVTFVDTSGVNLLNNVVDNTLNPTGPGLANTDGNFNSAARGQNNRFEGFYIDRIIVGFTERGEQVTNAAAAATTFTDLTMPDQPKQVLSGAYQLEIRRGSELGSVDLPDGTTVSETFDTNDPLDPSRRTTSEYGPKVGDPNQPRQQGQIIVQGNIISNAKTYGISIDAASRDVNTNAPTPGVTRNFATLDANRLVPGVVVMNNVVAGSGTGGILFSGDPNTGSVPLAAVPFGRIVNNTIYGGTTPGGIGVNVTENAGPTLLNNLFANLAQGVRIDGTSAANTVVGMSAYWNTATQVTGVTESGQLTLAGDPFVNAAARNFYLVEGSRAIDSALNSLQDRPNYVAVTSPLGIPASPILAPDRDLYGQLRGDDLTVAPPTQTEVPGLGKDVFKDRGAIDRVDFTQPWLALVNPLDQGPLDQNANADAVILTKADARGITQFTLQLNDVGVGIDKATVTSAAFTLTRTDLTTLVSKTLTEGTDYLFRYLESSNQVVFESASVYAFGGYMITATTRASQPGVTGLLTDLANNTILPNKADGTTSFLISLDDVPGAPTNLVGVAGDEQVTLTWTAPLSNGQSPVIDYLVQYSTDGINWTTFADGVSTTTGATVTSLQNLTPYWFRVSAINAVGTGPAAQTATMVTPHKVAPAPINLAAVAGNAQVALTWTAPTGTGYGTISDYTVEYSSDGGLTWTAFPHAASNATAATVIGLINGTTYQFRVTAVTEFGPGQTSNVVSATPIAAPAPLNLSATAGDRQVSLAWTAPTASGFSPITGYSVEYSSDGGTTWTTFAASVATLSTTVTGLTNGQSYVFRVTTLTLAGPGDFATKSAMPEGKPLAPTGLAVAIGDQKLFVSWNAPTTTIQTGGRSITDYRIEYSANGGLTWTVFPDGVSTATAATVTGLTNGTAYLVRVAAINVHGMGPYATAATAVAPQPLSGPPTRLTGRAGNGFVDLVWTAPRAVPGVVITDYVIQYSTNGGGSWTTMVDGVSTATKATVAVPTNGIPYVFRVAAKTVAGIGAWSLASPTLTPYSPVAVPAAPTLQTATKVANGSVKLTWVAPPANAGGAVNGYVIQYRLATSSTWTSVTVTSTAQYWIGSRLLTGGLYSFRVAARNLAGVGAFSNVLTATA